MGRPWHQVQRVTEQKVPTTPLEDDTTATTDGALERLILLLMQMQIEDERSLYLSRIENERRCKRERSKPTVINETMIQRMATDMVQEDLFARIRHDTEEDKWREWQD